jgi:hypothetical protein
VLSLGQVDANQQRRKDRNMANKKTIWEPDRQFRLTIEPPEAEKQFPMTAAKDSADHSVHMVSSLAGFLFMGEDGFAGPLEEKPGQINCEVLEWRPALGLWLGTGAAVPVSTHGWDPSTINEIQPFLVAFIQELEAYLPLDLRSAPPALGNVHPARAAARPGSAGGQPGNNQAKKKAEPPGGQKQAVKPGRVFAANSPMMAAQDNAILGAAMDPSNRSILMVAPLDDLLFVREDDFGGEFDENDNYETAEILDWQPENSTWLGSGVLTRVSKFAGHTMVLDAHQPILVLWLAELEAYVPFAPPQVRHAITVATPADEAHPGNVGKDLDMHYPTDPRATVFGIQFIDLPYPDSPGRFTAPSDPKDG